MSLTDADLPSDLHQISQVFSGMLWKLRGSLGTTVDKIVFHSIRHLLFESKYEDLIFALMAADRDLSGGANACAIYDAAIGRGLVDRIDDLSCSDFETPG